MEQDQHLAILRTEGALVAALPADALGAPVPSLPGWDVEHVVRHLTTVHGWVLATLAADPSATLDRAAIDRLHPATGPGCLAAYAASLDALADDLARRDPDQPAAGMGDPVTVAFWARRQAHEVAVHRIDAHDALHALGGPAPAPLPVEAAGDALDEWARYFLAVRWNRRYGPFPDELTGRTVRLEATDRAGSALLLGFRSGKVVLDATDATGPSADVALRGRAEDLVLTVWRRRPLTTVEVAGDHVLAERLLELARF